jgi:hypothetical protein
MINSSFQLIWHVGRTIRVIINIDISKIEPKYLFQQSEFNKEVNLLEIFENMNPNNIGIRPINILFIVKWIFC